MDAHGQRLAAWLPLAAGVREVSDELLLLGVDRDHRGASPLIGLDPIVDELELLVAIGMCRAFQRLVRGLEAVPSRVEQLTNLLGTHGVALLGQFLRKLARALRGPAQRRLRVAACHGVDERLERLHQFGVAVLEPGTPSARLAHVHDVFWTHAESKFISTGSNRRP